MLRAECYKSVNRLPAPVVAAWGFDFGRLESVENDIFGVLERSAFEPPVDERFDFGSGDLDGRGSGLTPHYFAVRTVLRC